MDVLTIPTGKYEELLETELDLLWRDCSLESMLHCRQLFVRASVSIASQRWVTTAVGNQHHQIMKTRNSQVT